MSVPDEWDGNGIIDEDDEDVQIVTTPAPVNPVSLFPKPLNPNKCFSLQNPITYEMMFNGQVEMTPENASQCVMVNPAQNLIFLKCSMNNQLQIQCKSWKQYQTDHKKTPLLDVVCELPPVERFDLMNGMFDQFHHTAPYTDINTLYNFIRDGLCESNNDYFHYLLDYIAHIFQRPQEKGPTLLMFGNQGTGKGLFFELLSACLHPFSHKESGWNNFEKYSMKPGSSTKLLINIDECNTLRDRDIQILKDLITNPFANFKLNPKNDPVPIPIYYRLFIFANNSDVIKMNPSERRYFALNPTLKKKPYYNTIINFLYDGWTKQIKPAIINTFIRDMLNRNIAHFQPHDPLVTGYQADIIRKHLTEGKSAIVQFVIANQDWLRSERPCVEVFEEYSKFLNDRKLDGERRPEKLGEMFREFCTKREQKKQGKTHRWYKLQEGLNLDILK